MPYEKKHFVNIKLGAVLQYGNFNLDTIQCNCESIHIDPR